MSNHKQPVNKYSYRPRPTLGSRVFSFGVGGVVILGLSNIVALLPARLLVVLGMQMGLVNDHSLESALLFIILATVVIGFSIGACVGVSWHLHFRKFEPHDPNKCRYCGYSLREIEVKRCPECGGTVRDPEHFTQTPWTPGFKRRH